MPITEEQYKLTSEELADVTGGVEKYKARIAALRAAEAPQAEPEPPAAPLVVRDASLGDDFIDPNVGAGVDEVKIREERRQAAQAQIAVQQELFNRLVGQAREEGTKRAAQTRAVNVRAGLAGGSFATQAAEETEAGTRKVMESIERERAATVSSILAEADKGAAEEARAQKAEAMGQAEFAIKARAANYEKAKSLLTSAGAQGVTAEELKQQDPNRYQNLVNQIGSELELKAHLLSGVPKDDILFKDNVGNKVVIVTKDRAGKISKTEFDLGEALGDNQDFEVINGHPAIITYSGKKGEAGSKITSIKEVSGFDKAGAGAELTPAQTQNFLRISDKYQADKVMEYGNKGVSAITIADQVLADPNNAGNQLKILYTLVKNLDPDSAVREGELQLAQQTQSYFDKFKTTITRIVDGKLVSGEAAKELAGATKELAQIWYEAAKRRDKQYISQANTAGVGEAFNKYLGGFERPYSAETGEDQKQAAVKEVTELARSQDYTQDEIDEFLATHTPEQLREVLNQ